MSVPETSSPIVPSPPAAVRRSHLVRGAGRTRDDPYFWLRDDERSNAEVRAHLEAENAYTDRILAPVKPLIETLYVEMVGRLKQDDASVPVRDRGYWYQSHYQPGREYPIYTRRRDANEIGRASCRERV